MTTYGGCVCAPAWSPPEALCPSSAAATFAGCGMRNPCREVDDIGALGAFTSWCVVQGGCTGLGAIFPGEGVDVDACIPDVPPPPPPPRPRHLAPRRLG